MYLEITEKNILNILIVVFVITTLIQLFYYLFFFLRFLFYKKKSGTISTQPVSVIICAKNEYKNLKNFLPLILEQNYPNYEVVVVDDCSEDKTNELLLELKKQYSHLRYTTILPDKKFTHGKKLALSIGIKAAKHDLLLLTDADCRPTSKNWIMHMQQNFTGNTQIVLGYGGYEEKKSFLNKLIRYDTFFIALQYFSYALAKLTYMGVGRNLAYVKPLFYKVKGFASHAHIPSGDDDLFVNETATSFNTRIEIHPESHIRSVPHETFKAWWYQKKRHLLSGSLYKTKHKLLLSTEIFSRCFFYISFFALLIYLPNSIIKYLLTAFGFRLIIQLIIFKIAMNRLGEKKLLLYSLLFDIIIPYLNAVAHTLNYIAKKRSKW